MAIFQRGEHFAKHVIGKLVATGRFAEVYEATAADGSSRALKVLKEDVRLGTKAQARLAQECAAVATIEHTHVVGYHGAGFELGRVWLSMELVRGPNLRQLVRATEGPFPVERAVSIVRQAAEGIAAAHVHSIVHRDLEPENILVGPGDLVKVADFGSANVGDFGVRTTASEGDLASCLYMAPEYLKLNKAEISNDVYGLGLILYELVAGVHPIATGPMTPIEAVRRHLLVHPPALATFSTPERPIPGDLSELLLRAMAKKPANRCSMRELADGLAVVLTRLRAPRRAEARSLPMPDRSRALAPTEQAMAASGPGGTMVMAAQPAVQDAPAVARVATLPPAPSGAAPLLLPEPPSPLPTWMTPAPVWVSTPGERRSTGAPVERPAPPTRAGPRAPPAAIAVAGAVLALGLVGAGWVLLGSVGATSARAPPAPARAPPTASATAPPFATSSAPPAAVSAPRPRASAAPVPTGGIPPPRSRPAPPPQWPRLPFQ